MLNNEAAYVAGDRQLLRSCQPNLLARTFRSGRDAAIGVAVPDISDPFFAAVIRDVEVIARDRGVPS